MTMAPGLRHLVCASIVALGVGTAQGQDWPAVEFDWDAHPSMKIGDVRLEVAARADIDARQAAPAVGRDRSDLSWGDPRVEVRGRIVRQFNFEVSRDFGDHEGWRDAFFNVRLMRSLEIEAGRFKIPFGREMLVGRANLDFIYRSLGTTQLAPNRDTGVMAHGSVLKRRLRYQAGFFRGDGDNARTAQTLGGQHTVALRLVAEPFAGRDETEARLQIGVAMATSHMDTRLGLRGETLLEDGVFFDRVYVNGRRLRTGLEAFWTAGPTSLAAEYMAVSDERNEMGFRREDLPAVRSSAWSAAGTWAITGERKRGRLEPRRAVTAGGTGAVELVSRIEGLRFEDVNHAGLAFDFPGLSTASGNAERAITLGVNWYLTRNVRLQYNVMIEQIANPESSPAPTRDGRIRSAILRLQLTV